MAKQRRRGNRLEDPLKPIRRQRKRSATRPEDLFIPTLGGGALGGGVVAAGGGGKSQGKAASASLSQGVGKVAGTAAFVPSNGGGGPNVPPGVVSIGPPVPPGFGGGGGGVVPITQGTKKGNLTIKPKGKGR